MSIKPKNKTQAKYIEAIQDYPVSIGIGPAGTGKTYLAISEATILFKLNRIDKIVILRPAVTSENLGYLPGTLEDKLDPYLKPLFNALQDRFGIKKFNLLLESGEIEIVALAYIKGCTYNNCVIILDEAQDTTIAQMRLFLTRLGENVTCIITGDLDQSDIYDQNGLNWAIKKLNKCSSVKIIKFNTSEIVRSKLVKELLTYIGDKK